MRQHFQGSALTRALAIGAAVGIGALAATPGAAMAEDTITLGSAISITGKYSQEGKNASDGYNFAVKRINEMGGVKIGGKTYKLAVKYYDDRRAPRSCSSASSIRTRSSTYSDPTAPVRPRRRRR